MKQVWQIVLLIMIFPIFPVLQAEELTGRNIMLLVDERDDGSDRQSEMEMILISKKGKTRERQIRSFSKDYGEDSKSVMVFDKPADVKGTGFLSWEYDDEDKDDDRWLYMPAMKKVRRISGSSSNDYFMGSDFTYDDMGDRNVDEDEHTLLREEEVEDNPCWVVQSIPKDDDSDYIKKIVWIRKDINFAVKAEYYDKTGLMKILTIKDIRPIDGIWTAHEFFMDNLRKKHQTQLIISNIVYDQGLNDNLFTVSAIERGRL
jgi:hypothetical protein